MRSGQSSAFSMIAWRDAMCRRRRTEPPWRGSDGGLDGPAQVAAEEKPGLRDQELVPGRTTIRNISNFCSLCT